MKRKIIIINIFLITLLVFILYLKGRVKPYQERYFTAIHDNRPGDEYKILEEIYNEGKYDEYINKLKSNVNEIEFPKGEILFEYIAIHWNNDDGIYAVLYNDKTLKYIGGHFIKGAMFSSEEYEIVTDELPDENVNFTVWDNYYEESITLSDFEYNRMICQLGLISFFNNGQESFSDQPNYIDGFYFNEMCYDSSRNITDVIGDVLTRKLQVNCEKYLNKCMGK